MPTHHAASRKWEPPGRRIRFLEVTGLPLPLCSSQPSALTLAWKSQLPPAQAPERWLAWQLTGWHEAR